MAIGVLRQPHRRNLFAHNDFWKRTASDRFLREGQIHGDFPENLAFPGFQLVDGKDFSAEDCSSCRWGRSPTINAGSEVSGSLHLETEEPAMSR